MVYALAQPENRHMKIWVFVFRLYYPRKSEWAFSDHGQTL